MNVCMSMSTSSFKKDTHNGKHVLTNDNTTEDHTEQCGPDRDVEK